MTVDLSKYRLNDESELDKYMADDPMRYIKFQAQVYNMLDSIADGDAVNVCDVCVPQSVEVFIKTVCMYILMHRCRGVNISQIEFSQDYRRIYRRPAVIFRKHKDKHFYSRNHDQEII